VNWSRIAYNADDSVSMPSFSGTDPWRAPRGPVPAYPTASLSAVGTAEAGLAGTVLSAVDERLGAARTDQLRDEIRRLVLEELAHLTRG
jgi:hypothetical protein